METEGVWASLSRAVRPIAQTQPELWELQVGEWAIVGQIFCQLASMRWPTGFVVDIEWNRQGVDGDPKRRPSHALARPDIIVHRRGKCGPDNNLLVAEFKWDSLCSAPASQDTEKVREIMCKFGYRAGAVVSLRRTPESCMEALWMHEAECGDETKLICV